MFQLNNRVSILEKRKRVGRGGSRGGTSGKGSKGQKARTGGASKIRAGFEGGQMPLHRRLPKCGFNNKRFEVKYEIINLKALEFHFANESRIDHEALIAKNLIKNNNCLVKILGFGVLTKKFNVLVNAFSQSAVEAIKVSGGEVHIIEKV